MNGDDKTPRIMRYEDYRAQRAREERAAAGEAAPVMGRREHGGAFLPEYYEEVREKEQELARHVPAQAAVAAAKPVDPVDELKDHNYDGIQEYDNPTPGWWYAVFIGTVVFSLLYVLVYPLMVPSLADRHARAEARSLEVQFAELNELESGEFKVLKIMSEESWLDRGAAVFQGSCAICHNADGAGLIGPNLTDENYKNIGGLMDIAELVSSGTENGSMPAQKNLLNENEIALVTAYVASLRGKNLPTPETVLPEYEGEPIAPWPTLDDAGNVVPARVDTVGLAD